jgi:phytoene dehydrogenase-like protein
MEPIKQQHQDLDAIVVGGGLAGLAAASYLARAGRRVALYEKSANLGGRAVTQERGGFYFNLGAHALQDKSDATQVLAELGVPYSGGKPQTIWGSRDGEMHIFPAGPLSLLRTALLSPAAKLEAGRALIALQTASVRDLQGVSFADWLRRSVTYPEVRALLEAAARVLTYTNAPEMLSAGLVAERLRLAAKATVIYIDGGWQTLVDGLRRVAEKSGVEIVTGAGVEAIEQSDGSVTGVRLRDGSTRSARSVVIAASPHDASRLVGGEAGATLRRWDERAEPARFACLDVALRSLPAPDRPVVVGIDKPLFFSAQSLYSKVAPEGQVLAYTFKYLEPGVATDAAEDRRELEEWLDLVQPGWRDQVVDQRFLPHMEVSNAIVSAAQGGIAGRPGPEVPGVRNLYVAGDWVGSRGMLVGASLASARTAARMIIEARQPALVAA